MPAELTRARQTLTQIKGMLKQERLQMAIESFYSAVVLVIKNPLMKQEKEEFGRLIEDALTALSRDPMFRKHFPLQISYAPGQERELLKNLKELMEEMQKILAEQAKNQLAELEKKRLQGIERAQALIEAQQFDEAKQLFDQLIREFKDNTTIKAEAGERFLKAGRFEEAYEYLAAALDDDPSALHLYNRIGMALRKLSRFDVAERYYFKALEYAKDDGNLFFNIGRLYFDWQRWEDVAKWSTRALKHRPDFPEAQKMLAFAQKKLGENHAL